ncbi:MAG TPA: 3-phosphoshikimate 1-carboxyvinyltransferase [Gammaproteobacteria bacterium]
MSRGAVEYVVTPGGPLRGTLAVPGDKSVSHRAVMLGAIAEGETRIQGFLDGEDTNATVAAFRELGVGIERPSATEVVVHGVGLRGLRAPKRPLDLGNSGTSTRLLAGILCGQEFESTLIGDASLSKRPMKRVTEPLERMGARIECTPAGTLPMRIRGGSKLRGIDYTLPVASAQLKSALLLAGLYAEGRTCVTEPAITRDHTERMLGWFGCPVEAADRRICIEGRPLRARAVQVPGDISSAAFFMVAASIVPGSELTLTGVGINPTRSAVIDILNAMGAELEIGDPREVAGEPVADIRVRQRPLRGVRIPAALVPVAIDEFPAILVAAAFAEGETVLTDAAELRVKESDRIQSMAEGLTALGIRNETRPDGITVTGGAPSGGAVESHGDHRIAMAFAVAGVAASGPVRVRDCANVDTSFPGFPAALQAAGGRIETA